MILTAAVIAVLIITAIKVYLMFTNARCTCNVCLVGKTALITGANSGMGYETALALARRGCKVIMADKNCCSESKKEIIRKTGNSNVTTMLFDFTSLKSVRQLAKNIIEIEDRLDILINNAGIFDRTDNFTQDGLNTMMQVNHFGPFLLTYLLVGLLKKSAPSRIIFVSSISAHWSKLTVENLNSSIPESDSFRPVIALYANTKLCNVITACELARKLKNDGVTANSLHPGVVTTPLHTAFYTSRKSLSLLTKLIVLFGIIPAKILSKNPEEGAQTAIHLALSKELTEITGSYFVDCKEDELPILARNLKFSKEIWKASENFVNITAEERELFE